MWCAYPRAAASRREPPMQARHAASSLPHAALPHASSEHAAPPNCQRSGERHPTLAPLTPNPLLPYLDSFLYPLPFDPLQVGELGALGLMQLRDLNAGTAYTKRAFSADARRVEEMQQRMESQRLKLRRVEADKGPAKPGGVLVRAVRRVEGRRPRDGRRHRLAAVAHLAAAHELLQFGLDLLRDAPLL